MLADDVAVALAPARAYARLVERLGARRGRLGLLGLVGRRSGSVMINGVEAVGMPPHRIARFGLGYCPEERGIFASLSCEENLLLPPAIASGGMELNEIYTMFPNLRERRASPGMRLSGGERNRVHLAKLLRRGSNLLLEAHVIDVTDGDGEPVLALLDWQQREDSPIFLDRTFIGEWNSPLFGAHDWTPAQIPVFPETLRAPYAGRRHLRVLAVLRDEFDEDEVYFFDELDLYVELGEIGWREFPERRLADEVAAIRLAMAARRAWPSATMVRKGCAVPVSELPAATPTRLAP